MLPKAINKLNNKMNSLCKSRIPKIQHYNKPLPPSQFKNDGSLIIRDTLFIRLINNLNHLINLNVKGHKVIQMKSNYKFLMITLNMTNKHSISSQKSKMKLIHFFNHVIRFDINKRDTTFLAKDIIKLISNCMVLNQEAYSNYFKVHHAWKMWRNQKQNEIDN